MGGSRGRSWAPPPMNGYEPMIVNVALTGAVPSEGDNPAVAGSPTTGR
jgi:hypothetical protein